MNEPSLAEESSLTSAIKYDVPASSKVAFIRQDIFIPANTTQHITLMQEYEWFETEYTLYAIHPKTKKQRVITGMFQSTIPTDNYVKQENIK